MNGFGSQVNPVIFCFILLFALSSVNAASDFTTGRDPTKPAINLINSVVAPKTFTTGYELQSIIIRKTKRLALINGQYVTVGDAVGEAKVIDINRNDVVLLASGKKITLYLFVSWKKSS